VALLGSVFCYRSSSLGYAILNLSSLCPSLLVIITRRSSYTVVSWVLVKNSWLWIHCSRIC
jgi:hypothetical protein